MYYCNSDCQRRHWKDPHKTECLWLLETKKLIYTSRLNHYLENNPSALKQHCSIENENVSFTISDLDDNDAKTEILKRISYTGLSDYEFEESFNDKTRRCLMNSLFILCPDPFMYDNKMGTGLYLSVMKLEESYFKPNTYYIFNGSTLQLRAMRDIRSDEAIIVYHFDIIELRYSSMEERITSLIFNAPVSG